MEKTKGVCSGCQTVQEIFRDTDGQYVVENHFPFGGDDICLGSLCFPEVIIDSE